VSHGNPVKNQPRIHSNNVHINGIKKKFDFRCEDSHPTIPIKKAKKRQNKKVLKYANHAGMPPYKLRLI
jgi:hypothetical protein